MKKYLLITISFFIYINSSIAQQPLNYRSEQVSFKSIDGKITYAGTLTLPEGAANVPAIILVSGYGKQDRDGTIAGHPLFAQIAEYLSSNGIAVLRVDDRGTGKTSGVYETAGLDDFASDALSAANFIKQVSNINIKKIGVMGHGEGAAAAAVAAVKSKDIAFIISLAGTANSDFVGKMITKIQVPVLALNGDRDVIVPGEQSLATWKNYAALGGNRKVRTVLLSGLNHLFLPCRSCTVAEYPAIRADFSPRTLHVIISWMQFNI